MWFCKGFTLDQVQQLATPTNREHKEKKTAASSSTPTLVDPAHVSVLGKVEKDKAKGTPVKNSKCNESLKPSASKKRSSSRPSGDDLKQLDDNWAERFSRLEAMLLAKTFPVPVEPVVKPATDVTTSHKSFFDPGASTSSQSTGVACSSIVQATGEAVEEMEMATQPLEAPGAGTATQPVQAPGSVPDAQPTSEGDISAASESEADQLSLTGSLDGEIHWDGSPTRDQMSPEMRLSGNLLRRPIIGKL